MFDAYKSFIVFFYIAFFTLLKFHKTLFRLFNEKNIYKQYENGNVLFQFLLNNIFTYAMYKYFFFSNLYLSVSKNTLIRG